MRGAALLFGLIQQTGLIAPDAIILLAGGLATSLSADNGYAAL